MTSIPTGEAALTHGVAAADQNRVFNRRLAQMLPSGTTTANPRACSEQLSYVKQTPFLTKPPAFPWDPRADPLRWDGKTCRQGSTPPAQRRQTQPTSQMTNRDTVSPLFASTQCKVWQCTDGAGGQKPLTYLPAPLRLSSSQPPLMGTDGSFLFPFLASSAPPPPPDSTPPTAATATPGCRDNCQA